MSDTVFIVSTGENHEGSEVVGVYRSYDKAVAAAMAVETEFEGGWISGGPPAVVGVVLVGDRCMWSNGCDYVEVSSHVIES